MPHYLLALVLLATSPAAPAGTDARPAEPAPVRAIRLHSPITLDGVLSEAAWNGPGAVTVLVQRDPIEGVAPTESTEVRVAYDDEALYVGARMYDSHPDSIVARLCRRDVSVGSDEFTLFLDPLHDRRSGYYFVVSAAGVLRDGTLLNDNWDSSSWDGVWEARARVDERGWTAEMRIPFSQLRFRDGVESSVWGVDFRRLISRKTEYDYLAYQPRGQSGFVSRFPHLVGLEGVHAQRYVSLLPYVTSKAEYLRHDIGDPFNDGSRYVGDLGGDLRMGVGSSLTLNATVNPDFGQVEVDPAVVNLTDSETFFDEKRPFFVEGSDVYNFGTQGASDYWGFNWPEPTFFYTRRIGRNVEGQVPDADHSKVPLGTTILGAAKLSGRAAGWDVGAVSALTAREFADLETAGVRSRAEVEPLTYYGVARGLRELNDRRQGIGFMSTLAARSFDTRALRDQLSSHSLMTGLDGWTFLDRERTWVISGWLAGTQVTGTPARLTALQTNSIHYFQRPDAPNLSVDSTATQLGGYGSRLWINKEKGRVLFNSAVGFMSPGFDVADLGYQTQANVVNAHLGGGYKWENTGKARKYQHVIGALFYRGDFAGVTNWAGVWVSSSTEFINNYSLQVNLAYNPTSLNDRATRGGPLMRNLPGAEYYVHFDTDSKSPQYYFVDADAYVQRRDEYQVSLSPGVEFKPVSNLSFSFGPGYQRMVENSQYVKTVDDPLATATFGRRYVFGELDQTTVSANIRLNVSFTPSLSLELFAQPLISVGNYHEFKELARARSYDFLVYGEGGSTWDPATGTADPDGPGPAPAIDVGNPDFNFRSLRGNAVLRWEYLPGSTLFLVWSQDRSGQVDDGRFRFGNDLNRLLQAPMDNVFLAKVSYYFAL